MRASGVFHPSPDHSGPSFSRDWSVFPTWTVSPEGRATVIEPSPPQHRAGAQGIETRPTNTDYKSSDSLITAHTQTNLCLDLGCKPNPTLQWTPVYHKPLPSLHTLLIARRLLVLSKPNISESYLTRKFTSSPPTSQAPNTSKGTFRVLSQHSPSPTWSGIFHWRKGLGAQMLQPEEPGLESRFTTDSCGTLGQ